MYRAEIIVVVCRLSDLLTFMERRGVTDFTAVSSTAKVIEHTETVAGVSVAEWILWLPDWDGTKREQWLTLSHEIVHLHAQILRRHGVILTRESEEAYAYYYEALLRSIARLLDAYGRTPRTHRRRR